MANSAAQKALTLAGRTVQSCLVFLNLYHHLSAAATTLRRQGY